MQWLTDLLSGFGEVLKLISNSTPATIFSVVGLLLICLTCYLAYKAITTPSADLPRGFLPLVYGCLLIAVGFLVAGPSISLLSTHISTRPSDQAPDGLKANTRVSWAVRLITYDPMNPQTAKLNVSQLQNIGAPNQDWSFVADYADLKGYTAEHAVRMTGGSLSDEERVSAIIFPIQRSMSLVPATARGVLQVVSKIETAHGAEVGKLFNVQGRQGMPDKFADFEGDNLVAWAFDKSTYTHFCKVAQQFRCDRSYGAHKFMGDISQDWHPLGFSAKEPMYSNQCDEENTRKMCSIEDWSKASKDVLPFFGARAFLIKNMLIEQISGRYLIDFRSPRYQVIPDLGLRQ